LTNFRAVLAHDLESSLEDGPGERPVDRLRAFSKAPRLGTLLWRLKYDLDPYVYKQAVLLLANRARCKTPITRRLCELAIREWMDQHCRACRGARELIAGDRRLICPTCQGTGLHRHSDRSRAIFMGMEAGTWKKWAKKLADVSEHLTAAERRVNVQMHVELRTE
jgi:hypothetical protein